MMIYGRHKAGKSSLTFQLMDALINKKPWLGFPVEDSGPVIYLQLDMAQAEMRRVIQRGEAVGMSVKDGLYVPYTEAGAAGLHFNILNPYHAAELAAWCSEIKPIAVVIDTINDAFEIPPHSSGDINANIRNVYHHLRSAIGADPVMVFLNHKRKKAQSFNRKDDDDVDEDGYLGGSAWAAVVSAILEVRRSKVRGKAFLHLHALRLETPPEDIVELNIDSNGFFEVHTKTMTPGQMLMEWPGCIADDAERAAIIAATHSQADVFRDVAQRTGETFDAVKKTFQRHSEGNYPWRNMVKWGKKASESLEDA